MPETKATPKITVHKNPEGDVVLLLPRDTWVEGESDLGDGTVRLFLDEAQIEALQKEISSHMLETLIEKAEARLQKLPRESIRRDLGRAGVKALRRLQTARRSKQAMEETVEHAADVIGPWLDKFSFGK